ncbi:MAG: hypothetical protein U0T56_09300 [Ferruginibacter sp.]
MIAGQDEQVTLDHISQLNEGSLDVLLKQGRARGYCIAAKPNRDT